MNVVRHHLMTLQELEFNLKGGDIMAAYIVDNSNRLIGVTTLGSADDFNAYNVNNSSTRALTKHEYYAMKGANNEDH